MPIATLADLPEPNEVTYAEGRLTTRTYASRSFPLEFGRDRGQPARYVHRVFDEVVIEDDDEWEWTNEVVYTTPGGRKQPQLQVAREAGAVRKLRIQKVPTSGDEDAGYERLSVFGSVARREAGQDSDIDLLVEAPEETSSFDFIQFKQLLEQVLGRPIDLVEYGGLKPRLDDDIRRDAVLL